MTIDTKALPETLLRLIRTERVTLSESDGEIRLRPVHESREYIAKLRGSLAEYPDMSVDNFLARKHADKRLDL
jgi:hypothetical protein